VDSLRTLRYPSLFGIRNLRFVEADVRAGLQRLPDETYTALIHLAAITDAEGSVGKAEEVRRNNLEGTESAAEFCLQRKIPMIFPSSTSVYGSQSSRVDEDCPPDQLRPQSPYAETKLEEEKLIADFRNQGLRSIVLRLATIAGPSPGMRFHTAVNKFCWQACLGQPVTVWKTALHQKRPYLALEDAVDSFLGAVQALAAPECPGLVNVVTRNHTVDEILSMIRRWRPSLQVKMTESRIMNQLSYEVVSRYAEKIGFIPRGSIESCIQKTLEWLPSPA
jgi:UDP-glucose 4-epimerase